MPTQNDLAAVTTLVPTVLCAVQLSVTTSVAVYTVPASKGTIIKHGTLCNISTTPVTVSVSIVPSGGSVDGTHRIISGYVLGTSGSTETLPLGDFLGGACLGPGDAVHVIAGTANVVDVVLTGMVNG